MNVLENLLIISDLLKKNRLPEVFWPEVCPFCGKASRIGICQSCRKKIEVLRIREPRCVKCGKPVPNQEQEYCMDCAKHKHHYDKGMSLWLHKSPVSDSIYRFKFHNQRRFAKYYAQETVQSLGDRICRLQPDVMIPIPLHRSRRRKRGYNQAELYARELAKHLSIPLETQLLIRKQSTRPQKVLGAQERRRNLSRAFAIEPEYLSWLREKTILLVDDIYTTGSTVDAAAKILKDAGAQKVYYLTISIGQGN